MSKNVEAKRPRGSKTKTVKFNQLSAAERKLDEVVVFGSDEYYQVVEIDEANQRVTLIEVPRPADA